MINYQQVPKLLIQPGFRVSGNSTFSDRIERESCENSQHAIPLNQRNWRKEPIGKKELNHDRGYVA